MNELETAFMEKLSDKAANMSPEEKKAMEVIQKAWSGLSSSEKSKFIMAYAKNPSQAIDHIMKGLKKEDLELGEDKEDLEEIIGKIIKRFSTSGRADAAEKKANALEKKAKDRERLKKAKERIAASKKAERERKMNKEDLDEAKKPSDDEMIDVMGLAKNSKEAVKLIQKKYKMDAKTAEAEVKRLLKKLLGESLRKDIAQLSAKFPEGSEVTMKHNGKKGKVLSVGKDHVIVGVGNKTHTHKPDELIPESLDEYAKENPMIMKLKGKKVELLKTGSSFKPTFTLTVDGKEEGKFGSEKDAMKHFAKMTKEDVEESSSQYGKSVERIKDNKKKSKIKPGELDKLSRLRDMMKKANEELEEARVEAVPQDAPLKVKKDQQVLSYTTRGGQKMKVAVAKDKAFAALGHYRKMGMTNVQLESTEYETKSFTSFIEGTVDREKLVKVFDKLKKGSTVKIKSNDSIKKGDDYIEFVVKSKSTVRKGEVEKITLANKGNPTGVKRFLYKRVGTSMVSFAVGDMAASIVDIKESVELEEKTKWKMGDGRPRNGARIENERFWDLPYDSLKYIAKDAGEAMKANPTARKATTGPGNWADQVADAATVMQWRKKNGIKESVGLGEAIDPVDIQKKLRSQGSYKGVAGLNSTAVFHGNTKVGSVSHKTGKVTANNPEHKRNIHSAVHESVELDEALKTTHVVIDTADGNRIVSSSTSEKQAKYSIVSAERPPMNIKDKKTLKVVQLKKPVSLNKDIIGTVFKESNDLAEDNMDKLRKIRDDHQMNKINGVKIDATTG